MSSIHSRSSSQALARYSSQLAANHHGRTHRSSSRYSKLRTSRGGLGVKVDKHGRMSGTVRPAADGKVSLPGGLTLQAPPKGGLSTHQLAPNKLLVLTTDARGLVSLKTKDLGVALDAKKATLKGSALPTEVNGQKVVDLPGLGTVPAPDKGLTSSFLLAEDKLLSLKHEADGTVTVNTKTLGLETGKKGSFKGYVLPDANGKVDIGGKELDVSGLKPGKTKTKTIKVGKKKFKVKLRMNEDGTVTVQGKRKKSFFSKVAGFIGKALSFAGKFAPFLAAIPGLGWAAMAGRIFGAVKGVVDGIKSGNWLGAIGSAAGGIAGFAKGALGAIASKVSQVANFGQNLLNAVKHGLGKGLLPIIANGANLLAGLGGLFGNKALADTAGRVAGYASMAESARKGNFGPVLQQLVNELGPDVLQHIREQQRKGVQYSIYKGVKLNTDPKHLNFDALAFDWSKAEFSTLPPGTTSSQADRARQSLDPYASSFGGVGLVASGGPVFRPLQLMSRPGPEALSKKHFGTWGESANVTGRINNAAELAQYVFAGYNDGKYGPISIVPATLKDPKAQGPQLVHVVGISGTDIVENQATGWDTNFRAGFHQDNDMLYNAREAIKKAVPPRAGEKPLLVLSGHSQGGMIAQQLASDKFIKDNYTVVSTVTFGSPLIEFGNREGEVHRIAALGDPVPRLSLQSGLLDLAARVSRLDALGTVGQQNIGATSINPITTHNTAYTDESKLQTTDALGRVGGGATLQFNPQNRKFFNAPPSAVLQERRA